ncbi:MAG: CHAT domain-containing protein [Pseudanabaenaceae cyanobacterium bins.39]|nr:CHAT domain-containing protein [Pseudanabaenaceae cyanobacterium bins.39]
MFLLNRSIRHSCVSSILLKARQFGIFSVFAITASATVAPSLVQAQIKVDGSTATEVQGNVVAPVGAGTVGGSNLYHSFDQFNVPTSGVIFNTGNSTVDGTRINNIINRVTGDTPSSILGTIESRQAFPNANLYLLNPNGVVFSETARLDIGGSFHVTTGTGLGFDQNQKFSVDRNSVVFPSGDPQNIQFAVAKPAAIINQGNLAVQDGKSISITAGTVVNTGVLTAPSGNVDIAAVAGNSQVQLRSPDAVLGLAVTKDIIPTNWNGTISTLPKLAAALTGQAAEASQAVIKPDGSIALVTEPSKTDIAVTDGMAIASGKIDVASSNGQGGNVGVFGNQVGLVNAKIDASGRTGGGTVLIGGDLQGKGIVPNALQSYVDASSTILANGLLTGDGGKVIVWADRSTQFYGVIAARGGAIAGNGGFVEVSGKENLDYRGNTDTRAPNGITGTLLLDPTNITIAVTGGDSLTSASAFGNPPSNATISSNDINNATTNVILQATNNIFFSNTINIANSGISLTAQAGNTIFVGSSITTNGGTVRLVANDPASGAATNLGNISINAPITTNGGAIDLQISGAGVLSVNGNLSSGAGNITLFGDNTITINSSAQITSSSGVIKLDGRVTTGSGNAVNMFGNISSVSGAINISGNSVSGNGVSIFGFNNQITTNSGTITINGTSSAVNGNGLFVSSTGSVAISSTSGIIDLSGNSTNGTGGDGIQFSPVFTSNTNLVQTNGNINFTGNAANSLRLGLNIQPPSGGSLIINSGNGNLTFVSDRSEFPTVGLRGSGTLTLRPFSNSANLQIGGVNAFVSESFLTTLAAASSTTGSQFQNIILGNATGNNAIALANGFNISTPIFGTLNFAPITIQTASTFNAAGFDIDSSSASITISANQGISNLGNVTSSGGAINITSSNGNIGTSSFSIISSANNDSRGGDITITANNGNVSLQSVNSNSTTSNTDGRGGNITVNSAGDISVGNLNTSASSLTNGDAGILSLNAGNGTITLTGNFIDLSAIKSPSFTGSGGTITFANNTILSTPNLTILSIGVAASGNVSFTNALSSSANTNLAINAGNITFSGTVGSLAQPLGSLSLNAATNRFDVGAIASSISASGGSTNVTGDLVATAGNVTLGNAQLNGDISIVGDEINFSGTTTGTGNVTLKPFNVNQTILIGGLGDTLGNLDLTANDLNTFSGGTFSSLTIGHADGTGAISFSAPVTFAQPTTLRSPVGTGNASTGNVNIFITGNITATNSLTIQAGNAINIGNSARINSTGGALNVILNSDRDSNNSGKISIGTGALISTNGGDIVLGGGANPLTTPAVFNSFADHGVTINGSLNAAGGNITINGSNVFTGSGSNVGVHISSGAQVTTSGAGTITITGSGGNGGSNNHGVEVLSTGTVIESANGNITISGTGNGTTSANNGLFIANGATIRTTGSGSLNLFGTSNSGSTSSNSSGIVINQGTLTALGTGNILLNGTSGTGGTGSVGISITGISTNLGLVGSTSGLISMLGTSRATTGDNNQGVLLGGNATVRANSTGNIAITGIGGTGVNSNQGILLEQATSNLIVASGALSLTGTGNGSGINNHGVAVNSGVVDAVAAAGSITMTGSAPVNSFGIIFNNANIKPTNTSGLLLLNADEMESTGLTTIRGTGLLFLHPLTATRNITLGGTANANNGSLELSDAFINSLQNGFDQIFIGRSDSSGLFSLANNLNFSDNLTLRSQATGGSINTTGFSITNTDKVTLLADQNITTGNITASSINLTSNAGTINTSAGTLNTSSIGEGGAIDLLSTVGNSPITIGNINTSSTSTGSAGALTFGTSLVTFAGSLINLSSVTGNAGIINLAAPVIISSPSLTINTTSTSGSSGTVTFGNTLNSTNAFVSSLTLNAGNANVSFNGAIGNNLPLINLTVNTTGATNFSSAVRANSLATNAGGTTTINGDISTTGAQVYNDAVTVASNAQPSTILSTVNSNITFNGTVNGNQALTLNAGSGNITLGTVGNTARLGNLIANSSSLTTFNGVVNATTVETNAGGTTNVNANINTTATQTYGDTVNLSAATIFTSNNATIAFNGDITGNQALRVVSGTGDINFRGTVNANNLIAESGGITRFNNVNATSVFTDEVGTTELNGNITTTVSQIYNDPVSLTAAVQLQTTNAPITFNGNVTGGQNLTLSNSVGNIAFNGLVNVGNLTVNTLAESRFAQDINATTVTTDPNGTTVILGNVTTSGNQTYQDAVLVGANSNFNSTNGSGVNGTLSFARIQNAVIGTPSNVTFNTGTGNLNINTAGSLSDRLGNLTISSANNVFTGGTFANSLTQTAGTGETRLTSGGTNDFTSDFKVTTNQFALVEGGNLNVAGNVNIQAANGITIDTGSTLSTTGTGTLIFNADTNTDNNGTFLQRGIIFDTARTRTVNITAANASIQNEIDASQIVISPSVTGTNMAIGSAASGDFRIEDVTFAFLKAPSVTIAANDAIVSIGSNSGTFPVGMSLEIGTAASPARSITAVPPPALNFNVGANLSLAANTIQLGNTTVGGNLTFINPSSVGQVTGALNVGGVTNFSISNPDTDIILNRNNNLIGGVNFIGNQIPKMRDFNLRNIANEVSITNLPTSFRDLVLDLPNSSITLTNTNLTGKLDLTGQNILIDQDIVATEARLRGGNITIARNFTTTDINSSSFGYSLSTNSSGIFQISPTSNINVAGEFFDSGTGENAIAGNINSRFIFFNRPVNLVGDTKITSSNAMRFFGSINGGFALTLDANGNQVSMSQLGNITPLSQFIATNSTIAPYSLFSEGSFDKDNISINVSGDISLGNLINDRDSSINIVSANGSISTQNINTNTSATLPNSNGGNVQLTALKDITTANINSSATNGTGGQVTLTSREGKISTGNVNSSGQTGGTVFYNAAIAINAGTINSSGSVGNGGNVTLDPLGDVVVSSIDTSAPEQGGNVLMVSTGGNLRITDTIASSLASNCIGASICTSGGTGGSINLNTGGLGSFTIGDASINGSAGILTNGINTLNLGTVVPVLLGSSFVQGGISISPGGSLPVTFTKDPIIPTEPTLPNPNNQLDPIETKILAIREVLKRDVDRYFREGDLGNAFDVLERSYISELEIFTGETLESEKITIENTQDLLSTVTQKTGDVAALIYPVLLGDRIEILVIPPKELGKPFHRTTQASNEATITRLITDYRNNLRDVGSEDYLEQSQQLYNLIIRPIQDQLEAMKVNTLVFVMDSGLRVTPPAALHDGKQFLIEKYAIANIPAIRVTRVEERNRKATRVLAMGLTESVQGFSALPSVDIEVRTIASEILDGSSFLNKEFTINNLQNQRSQGIYNILHLGTHAQFISDNSQNSFIQFWDSRLRLNQIPSLRFDNPVIDMLTLSACQTAVGNNLGISGLAVESGARSVLASLWEVSDAGTAPLMISFYNEFPAAINKAQAMRLAQIDLLSGKVKIEDNRITGLADFPNIALPNNLGEIDLRHPFYWSSFILVGNWL